MRHYLVALLFDLGDTIMLEETEILDGDRTTLQAELRAKFAGKDRAAITALETIRAYAAYYKHFDKTYHVQLQLESIVFKGKAIPSVAALVETMFMAEVKNMLLTAGHDLDKLLV